MFEPMTREDVEQWVENAGYLDYQIELLSPTIGDPPEAVAEAVPALDLRPHANVAQGAHRGGGGREQAVGRCVGRALHGNVPCPEQDPGASGQDH